MARSGLVIKALRELGPRQVGLYAGYQLLLRLGYLRWRTPASPQPSNPNACSLSAVMPLPERDMLKNLLGDEGIADLIAEANLVVEGQFRRFGVALAPIQVTPPGELHHWVDYEKGSQPWGAVDPKFIWEPARFGWAFTLGRAYFLSGEERFSETFWQRFKEFTKANPTNLGPNWASAQEVALRLMAFTFAAQIFSSSPHSTDFRKVRLAQAIAAHAARIPPSILYARAQNNNHLLSEAAGLITAAAALPGHPQARRWRKLGWKWFNRGLIQQIDHHGAYSQHSANYHRLMLQLALWVNALHQSGKPSTRNLQPATRWLQCATRWLIALVDRKSGRVPNLGPNDGAYILPLANLPFTDYRPVLQAASLAFFGQPAFEPGPWDEMFAWLHAESKGSNLQPATCDFQSNNPAVLRAGHSWAYLRAAHFTGRPGHADQLHLDLWWRGLNIAQDAGTYAYNSSPPWDNALTHTAVHNTLTLNGQEQMTRTGRFLYLDQAQAEIISHDRADDGGWARMVAQHDGYRRLGVIHRRAITAFSNDRWLIEDFLEPSTGHAQAETHLVRLHWLLPDLEWRFDETMLTLEVLSPYGWVSLQVAAIADLQPLTINHQLVRAGELIAGRGEISPAWGWTSPTYALKEPALSFAVIVESLLPLTLKSEWIFPADE